MPYYQGPSINDVMSEGGGGGGGSGPHDQQNVKGCIKKHDMEGGGENAPKLHDVIYG